MSAEVLGMVSKYPEARIDNIADTLAGVSFPDPYRWLEEDSEEVLQWQRAQAQLASDHVHEWPHCERLRGLVEQFNHADRNGSVPHYAAGQWFRTHLAAGASQAQAMVSKEPMGEGRVLLDPMTENPRHPPFLSWISPSPDGRTLAVGLCTDGSENNAIRLIDVTTGRMLADPPSQVLMDNWTGGVHWLPDSSGFFFTGLMGAASEFKQGVYLHKRLPTPATIPLDIPWTVTNEKEYRMVVVSHDGRHAVAFERLFNTIPIAIASLRDGALRWRPFITTIQGTLSGHVVGERYIAVTDVGAPRGRLVAIDLDAEDPNNPENWQELIGQTESVLRTVTPVGDVLYLSEFVDTYARVRIVSQDGSSLGEVPLPDRGALHQLPFPLQNLIPKGHPDKFLFVFSSLTASPGIYSHTPGEEELQTLQWPCVRLIDTVVEDCWAVAADGTRIPYHVVRRIDVESKKPQPTLIYAYGAFNAPFLPQFPGPMAAFVAAGGVLVFAHLRGGGEFGLAGWQAGRLRNKQNSYNDLYAVAEDLIAAKRCTAQMLAVMGGSAGGLMAAVAATQRPELWAVVVPRVPRLDLIGSCRDSYGRMSTMADRANIDDPDEVRRLATFSPYHLVRDGVRYPAMFIEAGGTDPRCPALHARKFAARMQRASAGNAPILLHVWEKVGHGGATDKKLTATQYAEWLAFTMRHLRMNNWS